MWLCVTLSTFKYSLMLSIVICCPISTHIHIHKCSYIHMCTFTCRVIICCLLCCFFHLAHTKLLTLGGANSNVTEIVKEFLIPRQKSSKLEGVQNFENWFRTSVKYTHTYTHTHKLMRFTLNDFNIYHKCKLYCVRLD